MKQNLSEHFRQRLENVLAEREVSRADLARLLSIERSAVSQMLQVDSVRLPRVETLVRLSNVLNVSVDWLLALSNTQSSQAQILDQVSIANEQPEYQLQQWHKESKGERIRYLPSSIPDLCKLPEVIAFEMLKSSKSSSERQRERSEILTEKRLDTIENSDYFDMEICLPYQRLKALKDGTGYWQGLPKAISTAQLEAIMSLSDTLYPRLRVYLVDERAGIGAPYTIFGQKRMAIYMGDGYFVFSTSTHILQMHKHFDSLIRRATTQPPEVPTFIKTL